MTHSGLVSQVFQAAMRYSEIPTSATLILARRDVVIHGKGVNIDDLANEMERCFKSFDRMAFQSALRELNEIVHSLTGGSPFELYIPHFNKIIYQELIEHRHCKGYSFLEEGFTSMSWENRKNARESCSKSVRSNLRSWWVGSKYRFNRKMFDHSLPHFSAAYAISEAAFIGMPGKVNVAAYIPTLPSDSETARTYLVLDASYIYFGITWVDYENAIVATISEHASSIFELFVKFHFSDSKCSEHLDSLSRRLSDRGLPIPQVLESNFVVESHFKESDLLIFGITSLGYYTALTNGKVACFAGRIEGSSYQEFSNRIGMPSDFCQVVGLSID